MKPLYIILIGICFAVAGQMCIKHGLSGYQATGITVINAIPIFFKMIFRPFVFVGFIMYLCSSFFWLVAVSRVPLSYAYPLMSISYVLVLFLSWMVFKEHIIPIRWLGVAVIIFGVYLVSRTAG